ncbi:MAG: hypothetical protein ACYTF1_24920, partial [Planctomycetota bacterium]
MRKSSLTVLYLLIVFSSEVPAAQGQSSIVLETDYVKYVIGADGRNLHFIDKLSNTDLLRHAGNSTIASIAIGSQRYPASSVSHTDDRITIKFADTDA